MKRLISKDDWNKRCVFLREVDSTNRYALDLVRSERPPQGTVIHTDYQVEGRGQRGKTWQASPGMNALFSIIYYPPFLSPAQHFRLNQKVSLALFNALKDLTGVEGLSIKWPNDIYINDYKVAGILIQNGLKGKKIDHCVIGIGVNVNQTEFDKELVKASSLRLECGKTFLVSDVIYTVAMNLDEAMLDESTDSLDQAYMNQLYLRDIEAPFNDGKHQFNGVIRGVNNEGQLIIQVGNQNKKFSFGEITYG